MRRPSRYLNGQIRSAYADQIILTFLADMEITAYFEAMLRPNMITGEVELERLAKRPLLARILRPGQRNEQAQNALKVIDEMGVLYGEMRAAGPLSVPHLRRRFEELRELGTIWPNSVWAMLDDLDERGVRRI